MSHITRMRYGSQTIVLSDDQDIDALKQAAVDAARAGGGLLHVKPAGQKSSLDVLVTAGVPITFESRDSDDDTREVNGFVDFDDFTWTFDAPPRASPSPSA